MAVVIVVSNSSDSVESGVDSDVVVVVVFDVDVVVGVVVIGDVKDMTGTIV